MIVQATYYCVCGCLLGAYVLCNQYPQTAVSSDRKSQGYDINITVYAIEYAVTQQC
jgi:hypothetical protein